LWRCRWPTEHNLSVYARTPAPSIIAATPAIGSAVNILKRILFLAIASGIVTAGIAAVPAKRPERKRRIRNDERKTDFIFDAYGTGDFGRAKDYDAAGG
jgi:hypothetical protein